VHTGLEEHTEYDWFYKIIGAYRMWLVHTGYDWSIQDYWNIKNITVEYRITGAFRI